ncbi:MAG: dihydropteroate synthase, partial [Acidimicrobiia bacterium]|nr:dihydropteroate synthase [Acidimicrobiia bacterium]
MDRFWRVRDRVITLHRPVLMGVVNTTPDSFSDGGLYSTIDAAIAHGLALAAAGADIVDVGGESTRPGADPVDADTEAARVLPVVRHLADQGLAVSVDTMKPEVAGAALEAGAVIVNDVSGLGSPEMRAVVAEAGAGAIVMHMQGSPRTMQDDPYYEDVVGEIQEFLAARVRLAIADAIPEECLAVDPGIGFGKTLEHNLTILDRLSAFGELGRPLVLGSSRKRFLGSITGHETPADRDFASAVAAAVGVVRGADVIRVHDVASAREAALVAWAIVRESGVRWDPVVGISSEEPYPTAGLRRGSRRAAVRREEPRKRDRPGPRGGPG